MIYDLGWELGEHIESERVINRDVKRTIDLGFQTIAIVCCFPPLSFGWVIIERVEK